MRIADFKVLQYEIPLRRPLSVREETVAAREGFIIQLTDASGNVGYGEISPLPGLSSETLPEVLEQVRILKRYILNESAVPEKVEQLKNKFASWLKPVKLSPSARFGFEMSVLNLKANARNVSLAALINPNCDEVIFVNGLLQGSTDEVVAEARDMINKGYHSIKLKVGSDSLEEDIARVRAVNEVIEGKALLRVDANQAWTFEQAVQFGNEFGPAAVEYIEEPFADVEKIMEFYDETLIPVALDESLLRLGIEKVKSISGVEVLVVKPTVFGGIEQTWNLMGKAKQFGLRLIISSAFETEIGIITLANLAACFSNHVLVGLDTLKWFDKKLFPGDPLIKSGIINISQVRIPFGQFNGELVNELSL